MAASGVWTTLDTNDRTTGIFTNELIASRSALATPGSSVLFWPFGMTQPDALAARAERIARDALAALPKPTRPAPAKPPRAKTPKTPTTDRVAVIPDDAA